jgi:hypothetical protein
MFSTKSQLSLGRLLRLGGACLTILALSVVSANAWIHSASAHDLHQAMHHESSAHAADAHLDEATDASTEVEPANEAAHNERLIAEVHELHDAEHQVEVIAHAHVHADNATLHQV